MPTVTALPPVRRTPRRWVLPLTADPRREPPTAALAALAAEAVPLVRWTASAEGLDDGELRRWAAELARAGAWLAPPAGPEHAAAWRRTSDVFLAEGAAVALVWLPRPAGDGGVPPALSWPGSAHVDRVGLDLCARAPVGTPVHRPVEPAAVRAALGAVTAVSRGLPVVLLGLGCRRGAVRAPLCVLPRTGVDVVPCAGG